MKGVVAGVRDERWCQRCASERGGRDVVLVIGESGFDRECGWGLAVVR